MKTDTIIMKLTAVKNKQNTVRFSPLNVNQFLFKFWIFVVLV